MPLDPVSRHCLCLTWAFLPARWRTSIFRGEHHPLRSTGWCLLHIVWYQTPVTPDSCFLWGFKGRVQQLLPVFMATKSKPMMESSSLWNPCTSGLTRLRTDTELTGRVKNSHSFYLAYACSHTCKIKLMMDVPHATWMHLQLRWCWCSSLHGFLTTQRRFLVHFLVDYWVWISPGFKTGTNHLNLFIFYL